MKRMMIALCCCLSLVTWNAVAGDEPDAARFVEVGLHGSDVAKDHNKVTEYNQAKTTIEGTLKLRMMDQKDDLKYRLDLAIFSNNDMKMDLVINKGHWFKSTTSYNKFMHKLGHDNLSNLVYRETVNPETNQPGGKMLTNYDSDPNQDYFTVYEDLKQVFNIQLDTEMPSDLEFGVRAQTRSGYHQAIQLSHCDNCHVASKSKAVDQVTYDAWAKVHAQVNNKVDVSYKFTYSKFENNEDPTMQYIDLPRHPVNGGSGAEFGSRQMFGGEMVESGYINDNERYLHEVKVDGNVSDMDRLVGNASYSKLTNKRTDLELTTTAGSFRWRHKFSKKLKMDALFSYYKMDNDEIFIDLPNWREGRPGGGQDLDYVRYSAYDRTVSLVQVMGYYKKDANNRMSFSYRYKQVDRENTFVTYEDRETETVESRLKFRWDGRYGDMKASVQASYETIDNPFANAMGIIEEPANGYTAMEGNAWVYYYQRQLIGEATNLPSDDLNLRGSVSYRLSDRMSVNVNAGLRDGSNDDLNYYSFDISAMNVGLNLFAVLNEKAVLNFGFDHSNMETQAYFSVPVFDG